MQANRRRDTKPEIELRRALHAAGLRYRVCVRPVPEIRRTADIVFRRVKVAIEVRGCFWHGCPEHHRRPVAHRQYWADKITRNIARDEAMDRRLEEAGWTVLVVWEHEDVTEAAARVIAAVQSAE